MAKTKTNSTVQTVTDNILKQYEISDIPKMKPVEVTIKLPLRDALELERYLANDFEDIASDTNFEGLAPSLLFLAGVRNRITAGVIVARQ